MGFVVNGLWQNVICDCGIVLPGAVPLPSSDVIIMLVSPEGNYLDIGHSYIVHMSDGGEGVCMKRRE